MSNEISKSERFKYTVEPFQEDFTGRLSWHMLDLFPEEMYATHEVKRIEVAYHEEAYADETLNLYKQPVGEDTFDIEIRKIAAPAAGEAMPVPAGREQRVCASRVTFKQTES